MKVFKKILRNREISGGGIMLSKMYLLAGALCASSCALAASPSIGSVTARGETRIDNYEVKGSGTVFDGSVVETGQSISSEADLRLASSAEIDLWRDSRGTLYHDHFVLDRGTAQLGLTDSFRIQANGLVVVPVEAHSSGIVSIDPASSVTIEAKNGTLEVRNSAGAGLARVHPGHVLAFASASGKSPAEFSATGTVSSENGRYYFSSAETGMKYEVTGENLQSYVGASVAASGALQAAAPASAGIAGLLAASSIRPSSVDPLLQSATQTSTLIRGWSVGSSLKPIASPMTNKCPPDPLQDCCPGVPLPQCCTPLPSQDCHVSP
jgi:hypothetical protein